MITALALGLLLGTSSVETKPVAIVTKSGAGYDLSWISRTSTGVEIKRFGHVDDESLKPLAVVTRAGLCAITVMVPGKYFQLTVHRIKNEEMQPQLLAVKGKSGVRVEILGEDRVMVFGDTTLSSTQVVGGVEFEQVANWEKQDAKDRYPIEYGLAQRAVGFLNDIGVDVAKRLYSFQKNDPYMLIQPYKSSIGAFDVELTRLVIVNEIDDRIVPVLFDVPKKRRLSVLGSAEARSIEIGGGLIVVEEEAADAPYRCAVYDLSDGRFLAAFSGFCIG